jgi:hypothetical protein
MSSIIKRINLGLLIVLTILVTSGLTLMATGNDIVSSDFLLAAALTFPIFLATKGIEFIIKNQIRKAFLSILLLSLVCLMSIIFVFI